MLNIGFSELVLIVLAALLFIGPKDFPVVIRAIARTVRTVRAMAQEVQSQVDDVLAQTGIHDAPSKPRKIIDMEGNEQIAYDLSDLEKRGE
jgi:sec-independent protein translocase protein TatB